ncbi:uncharacterized protein LOC142232301 [Haematobia irritans]|uniref:uncharacterized protein LOC142232301 n=1 Tax=Haematobia irritans TaxID=7368 RepID=UPI003F4F5771
MDPRIKSKLETFSKYIPFIDFIVKVDRVKYAKFVDIKGWILDNKRYSLSDLKRIEQSIITQYKNLMVLDDKKIPQEIVKIFSDDVKNQYINLCSDDEDEHKNNAKEIPNSANKNIETKSPSNPEVKEKQATGDFLNQISDELLRQIEEVSGDHNKINNKNVHAREQMKDFHTNANEKVNVKCKNQNENKKFSSIPMIIDTISLDSEDEDSCPIIPNENNEIATLDENVNFCSDKQSYSITTGDENNHKNDVSALDDCEQINCLDQRAIALLNNQNMGSPRQEKSGHCEKKRKLINDMSSESEAENSTNKGSPKRQKLSEMAFARKNTETICSILMDTLQPYEGRIASMWESHKKPVNTKKNNHNDNVNNNNSPKPNKPTNEQTQMACIERIVGEESRPNKVNENVVKTGENHKANKENKTNSLENEDLMKKVDQDTLDRPLATENKSQSVNGSSESLNAPDNAKRKGKYHITADRLFKELECSFKGFEQIQNSLPQLIGSKRRSSIHAQTLISELLCGQQSTDYQNDNKRRSSMQARTAISKQLNPESEDSRDGADFSSCPSSPQSFVKNVNSEGENSTDDSETNYSLTSNKTATSSLLCKKGRSLQSKRSSVASRRNSQSDFWANNSSSSDSDSDSELNDFEKFRLAKLKRNIIENQPIVLLNPLTKDEIQKLSRPKKADVLDVHLVASRSMPVSTNCNRKKSTDGKKTLRKRPNNDPSMISNNTTFCALCSSRPSDLTNHYVRMHKSESYVSRLTSNQLDELIANTPFAKEATSSKASNHGLTTYSVLCPFCEDELIEPFMNLYDHYASHTGEYAYQCSGCKLAKPFEADIESHILHSKPCKNSSVQIMYRYPSNIMTIQMHYCKICNFVQLNKANVMKHLREHHDQRQAIESNVETCVLAAISDGPEEEEQSVNEEQICNAIPREMQNGEPDDDIPVCNEACLDETFDNSTYQLDQKHIHANEKCVKSAISPPRLSSKEASKRCHIEICDNQLITPPRPSLHKIVEEPKPLGVARPVYRIHPENVKYLGLYKCMVDDCYYSTDDSNQFLDHLAKHSRELMTNEYLECPYCNLIEGAITMPNQLLDHIKAQHQHMVYQCSVCSYRSCEAYNVIIHQKELHPSNIDKCKVFKCPGVERAEKPGYTKDKISKNVQKIPCPYCTGKTFYHSNLLEKHILDDHETMVPQMYRKFSCIYCSLMDGDQRVIRHHVALKHPDELPYICSHCSTKVAASEDFQHNLQIFTQTQTVPFIEVQATLDEAVNQSCNEKANETERESKPNAEQLLKGQEEIIKVRLRKLTERTGIAPDSLFRCPDALCGGFFSVYDLWLRHMRLKHHCLECQCPHCSETTTISLTDYKSHFEEHRRHTYICFHCPATFRNNDAASDHGLREHHALGPLRLEKVRCNLSYSYFILLQSEMLTDRSEFVAELLNVLDVRLKDLIVKDSLNIKCSWPISSRSSPWFEDYEKTITRKLKMKCFNHSCDFRAVEIKAIYQHVRQNHSINGTSFSCSHCDLHLKTCRNWDDVINHVDQHSNFGFFICTSCVSIHHSRSKLGNHIRQEHAARDVPVIKLMRNRNRHTSMGIAIVLANECLSFSTIRNCFCCGERGMRSDAFILHLKRYHKFVLKYFCDWCNLPIESLQLANDHYQKVHTTNKLKLRIELMSKFNISVVSLNDLHVHIDSGGPDGANKQLTAVKTELEECPGNDDSVIILEDDDVVAESHAKEKEKLDNMSEKPKLKCIAMTSLLNPSKTSIEYSTATQMNLNSKNSQNIVQRMQTIQASSNSNHQMNTFRGPCPEPTNNDSNRLRIQSNSYVPFQKSNETNPTQTMSLRPPMNGSSLNPPSTQGIRVSAVDNTNQPINGSVNVETTQQVPSQTRSMRPSLNNTFSNTPSTHTMIHSSVISQTNYQRNVQIGMLPQVSQIIPQSSVPNNPQMGNLVNNNQLRVTNKQTHYTQHPGIPPAANSGLQNSINQVVVNSESTTGNRISMNSNGISHSSAPNIPQMGNIVNNNPVTVTNKQTHYTQHPGISPAANNGLQNCINQTVINSESTTASRISMNSSANHNQLTPMNKQTHYTQPPEMPPTANIGPQNPVNQANVNSGSGSNHMYLNAIPNQSGHYSYYSNYYQPPTMNCEQPTVASYGGYANSATAPQHSPIRYIMPNNPTANQVPYNPTVINNLQPIPPSYVHPTYTNYQGSSYVSHATVTPQYQHHIGSNRHQPPQSSSVTMNYGQNGFTSTSGYGHGNVAYANTPTYTESLRNNMQMYPTQNHLGSPSIYNPQQPTVAMMQNANNGIQNQHQSNYMQQPATAQTMQYPNKGSQDQHLAGLGYKQQNHYVPPTNTTNHTAQTIKGSMSTSKAPTIAPRTITSTISSTTGPTIVSQKPIATVAATPKLPHA